MLLYKFLVEKMRCCTDKKMAAPFDAAIFCPIYAITGIAAPPPVRQWRVWCLIHRTEYTTG